MSAIQSFAIDLDQFARTLRINLRLVVKRTAFNLFGKIVRRTPVDTGRARASWDMTVGAPSARSLPPLSENERMTKSEATSAAMANRLADYGIVSLEPIYIINNVEYIGWLEHGKSRQAPAGMVQISLAEVEAEMAKTLADRGFES
jgi:hypothetical protein